MQLAQALLKIKTPHKLLCYCVHQTDWKKKRMRTVMTQKSGAPGAQVDGVLDMSHGTQFKT